MKLVQFQSNGKNLYIDIDLIAAIGTRCSIAKDSTIIYLKTFNTKTGELVNFLVDESPDSVYNKLQSE